MTLHLKLVITTNQRVSPTRMAQAIQTALLAVRDADIDGTDALDGNVQTVTVWAVALGADEVWSEGW